MTKSCCLILILFCLVCSLSISGQNVNVLEIEALEKMTEKVESTSSKLSEISYPLIISKQPLPGAYLVKDWSPAIVYSNTNEFLNTVARYNIHQNRIEIKVGDDLRLLQTQSINSITLNNALFVPLSSNEKEDGNILSFFKVLSLGELTLLVKHKLTIRSIGASPLHNNIGTREEFRASEKLYYCQRGEKPNKLKKGKKNILKLFGTKKERMEEVADENNLGFRKVKHLVSLFDEYNESKIEADISDK